jgi:hypothetical protein
VREHIEAVTRRINARAPHGHRLSLHEET